MADDILKGIPINSKGYGTIPKLVMQDRNISIGAKAVYAYFNSFAGGGDSCFPSRKLISLDLGISAPTLSKYLNELRDNGYITFEQVKENGRFSHNVYMLLSEKSPCTKILDTKIFDDRNLNTNNNNLNNNKSNNNNKIHIQEVVSKFNSICISFPKVSKLTDNREKTIKARLKEYSMQDIIKAFEKAEQSNFLKGKSGKFKAGFDWIMKAANFIKVLEGNYDNRADGQYFTNLNVTNQYFSNEL